MALRGHLQKALAAYKADARARAAAAGQAYVDEDDTAGVAGVALDALELQGEQLVGAKIRVWWPDDEAWYGAKIRKLNKWNGQYFIRYEADGVEEWLDLG